MTGSNSAFIFVILIICLISSFVTMNKYMDKRVEGFDRVSANLIGVDNYDNYDYTYLGEKFYKNPGTILGKKTGYVDYNNTFYSRLVNPVAYFAGDIYGTYGNPHYTWNELHSYYPNQRRQGLLGW